MTPREERGILIAAKCKIEKAKVRGSYYVPSQSKGGTHYLVDPACPHCDCPDFQEMGLKCKHVFAVEYTLQREKNTDGSITQTETLTVSETVEVKTTYKQDWPAYNAAQSVEKDRIQELIFDLCRNLPEPERDSAMPGRKPHSVKDSIFAMVFKTYSTFSARRFSSDLREAYKRGYLSRIMPGLKVPQFMEDESFTVTLKQLIAQSALPLKAVETDFAIDSSGFGSSRFERWFDEKYGTPKKKAVWVKCHIACGVKTNVVTAIRILDSGAADCPQFEPLVKETAKGFTIGEVSADKAYGSYANFETVAGFGGEAFIAFKSSATGAKGGTLQKMYHYFQFKQEEFLRHYHKRSNVESTFSMIKAKFGDSVRSKTDTAMVNEVLCKVLCHNLCCLIQEQHELGIETVFWPEKKDETRMLAV